MTDSPYIVELTQENFQQVVLDAPSEQPVLIDFWAPWCGPCQTLMPLLARLADEYQGKFILAKLNTEDEQELAAQFGIRSIPTVKMFRNGQVIDEFMGALPETEIRTFLDKHVANESNDLVEQAQQLLLQGDGDTALQILNQAFEASPGNATIQLALAQTHAAMGNTSMASELLDSLPADAQEDPEVTALRSHMFFEQLVADQPEEQLLQRLQQDDTDAEARYLLAAHRVVLQDYPGALDMLLILMQKNRQYGDDAARKAILKIFQLLGDDPIVNRYRSRMFNLLH